MKRFRLIMTLWVPVLVPLAFAEDTLTLTPLTPIVSRNGTTAGSFTTAVGSVTFTLQDGASNGTGTVTVQAPDSITGVDLSTVFSLSSSQVFTLKHTLAGFSSVSLTLFDEQSPTGVCTGSAASIACTVKALYLSSDHQSVYVRVTVDLSTRFSSASFSVVFQWKIGGLCSPASAASAARDAACPADSITIDESLPSGSANLMAVAASLPPFCAFGKYSYSGPNKAHIFLELLDQKGNIVGRSSLTKVQDFPSGSNQAWGGGCRDAKELIFITEQAMPSFNIPEGTPYNKVVGTLTLQASLYDSGTSVKLATSSPITYNIEPGFTAKSELQARYLSNPGPPVVPPGYPFNAGDKLCTSELCIMLAVTIDFDGTGGLLDASVVLTDGAGTLLSRTCKIDPQKLNKGNNKLLFDIDLTLPSRAATLSIQPRLTLESKQVVLLDAIVHPVNSIAIVGLTPDPKDCKLESRQNCLVAGESNNIQVQLALTPVESGELVTRHIGRGSRKDLVEENSNLGLNPPPAVTTFYPETIVASLPTDVQFLLIQYLLRGKEEVIAEERVEYHDFTTRTAQIAAGLANQGFDIVDGRLGGILSKTGQQVNSIKSNVTLDAKFGNVIKDFDKYIKGTAPNVLKPSYGENQPTNPAAGSPAFIGIDSTWAFDPVIPRDGGFSGSLSLNYSANQFPDHPNFVESRLQVVSIDSSGALHVYPTSLDLTNKVATASIDGLDPYYSLAVVGPFTQSSVLLATASSKYVLVNTGRVDTAINVTNYDDDGKGTPTASVLKAGSQKLSNGPGWVQAWANPSTLSGVSWFDNGAQFAITRAQESGEIFLLTNVEYDSLKSTEINLANTSPSSSGITVTLISSDGTAQGTYTSPLAAKASISARIEGLFPSLKPGFTGYAVIASRQPVTVSAIRWANTTAAGLPVQPLNGSPPAINTWYAAQLGGVGLVTTLHLVNVASRPVNLLLKAWSSNGTAAAANVSVQLGAGQQYTKAVTDIFGIAASTAGSIQVDADAPGVFGDVLSVDSSFIPRFAVSVPLTAEGRAAWVLPYANSNTTVYVFNPNSSAASVTATPYTAEGSAGTPSSASVPPFGRAAIVVGATGYVTVGSTQPVIAAGWMVVPSGTTTGYLALPASSASASPGGGSGPQISPGGIGNAASFTPRLVRGGLATIFGSNFVAGSTSAQATTLPLPRSLAGVSVTVGGVPAPLVFVNANQINFQVPFEVPAGSAAEVVVTSSGVASPAAIAQMVDYSVGVFSYARTSSVLDPIVVHGATNQLITPSNPAVPNEAIVIYGTGVGKFVNSPPTGVGAPTSPLATAADTPAITLGGLSTRVLFAGLTPGFIGLAQFNVQLPASVTSGNSPLVIAFPGDSSQPVNLAVQSATPTAPKLSLSSSSLAFGNVNLGQTKDLSLTVTNVGSAVLAVVSATVTGAGFSLVAGSPLTIQPGGSQTFTVRYAPTAAAPQSGSLIIGSNDPGNPSVIVALNGAGTALSAPVIELTPTSLDFGSVPSGQTKDLVVTVRNTGNATLTINFLSSSNARFVPTISAPFNVGPGSFQSMTVRFSPTAAGPQSGTLSIFSNDPVSPSVTVSMTGAGAGSAQAPVIEVTPTMLDFGSVTSGQTKDLVLTVRNNGIVTLTVNSIVSSNARFAPVIPTPFNVGAGSFQSLIVRFSPAAAGAQSGTLTIASNDPGAPSVAISVTGSGAGSAQAPVIDITPTSLDFGTVASGQNKDLVLTVRNNGTVALTVSSIVISNARFAATISTPFNVGAGSFQGVAVRFSPTSAAGQSGTLKFVSNDPVTPSVEVTVTGNGGGSGATCVSSPADLVSWWTADGNANDLNGGNTGTLQGGAIFGGGEVGQAFDFNGSSGYVRVGNPANLRLTTGLTIEGWIYPRTVPTVSAGPPMAAILTKWAQNFGDVADSDSYGLWLQQDAGTIKLFSAIHQAGPKEPTLLGGVVPLNAWTHVAVTFEAASGQYVLYVNGQSVAVGSSPGSIFATNHNVLIGREDSYIIRPFNGFIDELSVFNRALSAAQIQSIAGAGSAGKCKP